MAKPTANERALLEEGLIMESQFINAHRTSIPGIPHERTAADERLRKNRDPFIWFGNDNLFPQALARLNRRASNHRAIINSKNIYTVGKGFDFDPNNAFLEQFVRSANTEGETLKQIFRKLDLDFISQGNGYLEIVTDAVRSFLAFFHLDSTKGRVGKERDRIFFHPRFEIYRRTKDLARSLPLYPNFETIDGFQRSVFHFKDYEPEFKDYGIAKWIASMDAAGIAYKTNKWNLSRLDNSFQSSGVLMVDGKLSPDDAEELKAEFKREFIGEKNQGKILLIVKQLGGGGTEFTPTNNNNEGDWITLHQQSDQDMIIAHNWFRSLTGLGEAGKLGNTQQIRNEYQIARSTTIQDDQNFLLDPIKRILFEVMNVDAESLRVINESPISILDELDPNKFILNNEAREMASLEPLEEDDERGEQFVDDGTQPSVSFSSNSNSE